MSLTDTFIDFAERGLMPDFFIRAGIRNLCRKRLQQCKTDDCEANAQLVEDYIRSVDQAPLAVLTEKANEQHYEVPAAFYHRVLGQNLKYSSCYFEDFVSDLTTAENKALELTCEHADLEDGQQILELGCGWGSLSLWMAKNFPKSKITSVSNSNSQREYIMGQAKERNLKNLKVITADVNSFESDQQTTCIIECFVRPPFEAPRRPRIASGASKTNPRRPKGGLQALQDAPKAPLRRLQDASNTNPNTLRMIPTAPRGSKGAQKPSSHQFRTLQTSIFDPPDFDFQPSRPRFSALQTSTLSFSDIDLGVVAGTQLCCAFDPHQARRRPAACLGALEGGL